jgi:hypothetical protein
MDFPNSKINMLFIIAVVVFLKIVLKLVVICKIHINRVKCHRGACSGPHYSTVNILEILLFSINLFLFIDMTTSTSAGKNVSETINGDLIELIRSIASKSDKQIPTASWYCIAVRAP